jgi:hypothetical protein
MKQTLALLVMIGITFYVAGCEKKCEKLAKESQAITSAEAQAQKAMTEGKNDELKKIKGDLEKVCERIKKLGSFECDGDGKITTGTGEEAKCRDSLGKISAMVH